MERQLPIEIQFAEMLCMINIVARNRNVDMQYGYVDETGSSRDVVSKKDANDLIYRTCHK